MREGTVSSAPCLFVCQVIRPKHTFPTDSEITTEFLVTSSLSTEKRMINKANTTGHTVGYIELNKTWALFHDVLNLHLLLFSHSAVSDPLQPHERQHARLPCPLQSPEVAQTHNH